ncbi:glycosyltransferase [Parahaliea maris]|uniref:Glycosyltransferase n=1 Tax=Parahaliea maris TaxID=2716870 RepID=A0A5C8ZSL2_9GAMM|nr:glycosyltransferase [Parahaliea maris]TXS90739.1 glycosyltransferase [Parahaliea maris]
MKLSLCMIVRDEAFFLRDCLAAAAPHVDEMVVVDTGSSDATPDIAREFGARLFHYTWHDDYAAARNFSLQQATGDWILVLDADELITAQDYRKLRELIADTEFDGFYLEQRNYTEEQRSTGWQPTPPDAPGRGFSGYTVNPILRLFRRRPDIHYQSPIHEIVDGTIAEGKRQRLDIPIHHYVDANPARPRAQRSLRYFELMEQALENAPDGRLFNIAASSAMYQTGDFRKAHEYYLQSARMGYEPARSLEGAAEASYRQGEFGVALDHYQQAYDSGHRSASMCLNMANIRVRLGERRRAIALLEEALAVGGLGPEVTDVIRKNITMLKQREGLA